MAAQAGEQCCALQLHAEFTQHTRRQPPAGDIGRLIATSACSKEVQRAYFRVLSQLLIECVQDGCATITAAAAYTHSGDAFDISHSGRELLTKEMATKLFQPMLRQGEFRFLPSPRCC